MLTRARCELFEDKAPKTVANFVGLASGTKEFRDPVTAAMTKRRAYDGTTFHRVLEGMYFQGGDPSGRGDGEPGYVIDDEIWPGAKHDHVGLCMPNRGDPNTNGMQFLISLGPLTHLDGNYTIFGECGPRAILEAIGEVPTKGEQPVTAVRVVTVTIRRGG